VKKISDFLTTTSSRGSRPISAAAPSAARAWRALLCEHCYGRLVRAWDRRKGVSGWSPSIPSMRRRWCSVWPGRCRWPIV